MRYTLQAQVVRSDGRLQDVGFDNVLKGAAIVSDERQDGQYIDGYNTKYLDIIHHSERNFTKPEWKAGDPARLKPLPATLVGWVSLSVPTVSAMSATNVTVA